nr:armadillo repeat-containing kinesin-like protein 2 [Tanacetum cinerariifolium]
MGLLLIENNELAANTKKLKESLSVTQEIQVQHSLLDMQPQQRMESNSKRKVNEVFMASMIERYRGKSSETEVTTSGVVHEELPGASVLKRFCLAADFLAPLLPAVAEKPMVLCGFVWFSSQVSFTVLLTKSASIGTGKTSLVITIGPSPRHRTETASTILFGQM